MIKKYVEDDDDDNYNYNYHDLSFLVITDQICDAN